MYFVITFDYFSLYVNVYTYRMFCCVHYFVFGSDGIYTYTLSIKCVRWMLGAGFIEFLFVVKIISNFIVTILRKSW